MVERSVLLQEIDSLPPRYYDEVLNFVKYLKRKSAKESASPDGAAAMADGECHDNKKPADFYMFDGEELYERR